MSRQVVCLIMLVAAPLSPQEVKVNAIIFVIRIADRRRIRIARFSPERSEVKDFILLFLWSRRLFCALIC